MKRAVYLLGRLLQIAGLATLPFSLWVGFIGHDESRSIMIFLVSIVIFYAGYLLTRLTARL